MRACVIGSLNIDHVIEVERFAKPGETLRAINYTMYYGGKGGNQAIACSKLGIETTLVASIGTDPSGVDYLKHLSDYGVNTKSVKKADLPTGTAFIEVDLTGENKIVTVGGANYALDDAYIESILHQILDHDIFMFCLEIPKETTLKLLKLLREHNKLVILDPAPFSNFDPEMLQYLDYITPNETEYDHFQKIVNKHVHLNVVLKQGALGASIIRHNEDTYHSGYRVKAIDSVGAGDAFNAGLAYGLLNKMNNDEILIYANACGAITATKKGAQEGMPSLDQLNEFLKKVTPS